MQAATNITWLEEASTTKGSLYSAFKGASASPECNTYVKQAKSPKGMITILQGIADPTSFVGYNNCKTFWCGVLLTAMNDRDLSKLEPGGVNCSNVKDSKQIWNADFCACQGDRDDTMTDQATKTFCAITETYSPTASPTVVPTSATPTNDNVQRRLSAVSEEAVTATPCEGTQDSTSVGCVAKTAGLTNRFERKLQATTAAPASGVANKDLPDYEVDSWTQCTCYQQCVAGIRTRRVECMTSECKGPKPLNKESCFCRHCAACDVDLNLILLAASSFIQGCVAFLVFLAFAYFQTQSEEARADSLVRVSWLIWPLGLFCKQLPPLVRMLVIVNFAQLLYVLAQVWLMVHVGITSQEDCGAPVFLRVVSLVGAAMWLIQTLFGVLAKRNTRKPPYLYSPERPGGLPGIRQIKWLLRSLGP
jgi:hypothetical protein